MKKIIFAALFCITAFVQPMLAQDKCLTEILFQENAAKNPQILKNRETLEKWTEKFVEEFYKQDPSARMSMVPKIIPVVVHVIHYGGAEYIGHAQIADQIDSLNKDYRRMNIDTSSTPAVFKPFGADVNVEFRLAQLDPNGNCTDGVDYVYSPLTFNARDNVKALADWPSNKYLNLWVVSSIDPQTVTTGTVIGYAQFPGGASATDGVVIRSDYFGCIGTAAQHVSDEKGRTATHEIGHWLNLRHIWGDAQCGNDFVTDTPTQFGANLSICPSWPHVTSCSGNSPNGDMFSDYMDYTNGVCMNMFSVGQAARMNATLTSSVSLRNNLWTSANLIATGTDGTPPVLCGPTADFIPRPLFVCAGASLQFNDLSWNGTVATRLWTFPGGTPATDTSASPTILYNTPGSYDVTLTVTNAGGTTAKTVTGMVTVSPGVPANSVPFTEGFENGNFPFNDWYVINANSGNNWEQTSLAASVGTQSLFLNNFSGNGKGPDEFITPAFNLTNVTNTFLKFDVAYSATDTSLSNNDKLTVYYSLNCGQSWTARSSKIGSALFSTTNGGTTSFFIPTAAEWKTVTVNLVPSIISTQPNVRFRFEFTHDTGNNIYIDNINLTGVTGIDQNAAQNADIKVFPNPSSSRTYVDFTTYGSDKVKIEVMDISGRLVSNFEEEMPAGDHQYTMPANLEKGTYMVRLSIGSSTITKKAVIN